KPGIDVRIDTLAEPTNRFGTLSLREGKLGEVVAYPRHRKRRPLAVERSQLSSEAGDSPPHPPLPQEGDHGVEYLRPRPTPLAGGDRICRAKRRAGTHPIWSSEPSVGDQGDRTR